MAGVNGTSLYYEIKGRGFPLVLISGGGLLDRRGWDEQFEAFSKSYKVIRYDIRGIGKSARPTAAFSHSKDLHDLLKFLKVKKAHVVGLSFGGGIAVDFALDYPGMVDRLVLAASGTSSDAKSEANLQGLSFLSALAKKEGVGRMVQLVVNTPSFISKENLNAQQKIAKIYLENRDVFESNFPLVNFWQPTMPPAAGRLGEILVPALVLIAENDVPAYKTMTEKLAADLRAKVVVIPGSGHVINLDKPAGFNAAVLFFLNEK
jgi:pimeloyl-ACP methyl ester carboxylesterase